MDSEYKTLRLLYQKLIKFNADLATRSSIAKCLTESARLIQSESWNSIAKHKDEYSPALSSLKNNGYLSLSIPWANEITKELNSIKNRGIAKPSGGGRTETEYLEGVSSLESIQKLINNKRIFNLVSLYLGAPAKLSSVHAWWQYPMGPDHQPSNAQLWHRDRDDLSFLKLFFNATDVDDSSGPHAYIPGSHDPKKLSEIFSSSESKHLSIINGESHEFLSNKDLKVLGINIAPKIWIGKAGTCFLEDTRGLHRAYIPKSKPRLLLSLLWTVGKGYSPN